MLNMGKFTYVIKISCKILPFSCPFVDIYPQHWTPFCADGVSTCKIPVKPGTPKWNKERPKTAIRRYRL